ncbi:MAG: hypothetical protein AB8B88_13610 [Devosiaceae bacterium]
MRKVLSAQELNALLDRPAESVSMDDLVVPTADDLLQLAQSALDDPSVGLFLSDDQRKALREALIARLTGALRGAPS